jgi:hypothetical protein
MADIKQAAKWMQEGKRVRLPYNHRSISVGKTMNDGLSPSGLLVVFVNGIERPQDVQECVPLTIKELLADDWEIAQAGGNDAKEESK